MSVSPSEVKLPALAVDVCREDLTEISRRETLDGINFLLWAKQSGVNLTYVDIQVKGNEPVLVQIAPEDASDALEHSTVYAARAGYSVEELYG